MGKLTAKQRREIYLKAYEVFATNQNYTYSELFKEQMRRGICGILRRKFKVDIEDLPEIQLFNPQRTFWFDYTADGDRCRETVLLLCSEMCNQ